MTTAIQRIGKYLNKIYKKLRGDRLVPDGHLIIIEEEGQIVRLAGPGFVRAEPYEEYGPWVPYGPQAPVELSLDEVRSDDGEMFGIRVRVRYGFEPKRCNLKDTPQLVRNAPEAQQAILQDHGAQVVRKVVGEFESTNLRSGSVLDELEGKIERQLYRVVRFAGITLYGVAVTEIIPPRGWDTALSAAKENEIKIERTVREKQVLIEATADEEQVLAKATAEKTKILAEAEARARELTAEAVAKERRLLLDILAALDPELVERVLNAEVLGKFADNGSSMNFISSSDDPLNLYLMQMMAYRAAATNGGRQTNGGTRVF